MKNKDQLIVFHHICYGPNISVWELKSVPKKDKEKYGIVGILGKCIYYTHDKLFDYIGNNPFEGRIISKDILHYGLSYSICSKEEVDKHVLNHFQLIKKDIENKKMDAENYIKIAQTNIENCDKEFKELDISLIKYKEIMCNIKE